MIKSGIAVLDKLFFGLMSDFVYFLFAFGGDGLSSRFTSIAVRAKKDLSLIDNLTIILYILFDFHDRPFYDINRQAMAKRI